MTAGHEAHRARSDGRTPRVPRRGRPRRSAGLLPARQPSHPDHGQAPAARPPHAGGVRFVSVDRPGHPGSPRTRGRPTLGAADRDLADLADLALAADLGADAVIGSLGAAAFAAATAAAGRQRVRVSPSAYAA